MSRLDPRDSDTDHGLLCAAVHEAGPSEPAARHRSHRLLATYWHRVEHFADRLARSGHLTATGL
ncbi:hypothetical protein GCM10025787_03330 [Saccharopolyspora rosea]|uniref:Uncharacterized protein n=1 Tax=Saccharopolyspora rosea TaxID=524884 RepID=A0ABW3FQT4_9PSEU